MLGPKREGVVDGEAALALWDLADVNPRQIEVVVPPEYNPRRRAPKRFKFIRRALADEDIDEVDNIAVLTPRAAIRDAIRDAIRAGLPGQLIEQALNALRRRELIDPITEARLRVELADRNQRNYAQTKDKAVRWRRDLLAISWRPPAPRVVAEHYYKW